MPTPHRPRKGRDPSSFPDPARSICEHAWRIWPLLVSAAKLQRLMTYKELAVLVHVPPIALGKMLDPIFAYCIKHGLPPLTCLIVRQETGLPGPGFTAIPASDLPAVHARIFEYGAPVSSADRWVAKWDDPNPTVKDFEEALATMPAPAVPVA